MQRRGVVIPQFQEVMSPPKAEDQTGDISENNESITELFGETATPDEEAASSETTTNLPDANEEDNEGNRSLTF